MYKPNNYPIRGGQYGRFSRMRGCKRGPKAPPGNQPSCPSNHILIKSGNKDYCVAAFEAPRSKITPCTKEYDSYYECDRQENPNFGVTQVPATLIPGCTHGEASIKCWECKI